MNYGIVNNPRHYNEHPSGVECITIAQEYSFNLGNAIKYIWRAGIKTEDPIQDLEKAAKYIQYEIDRLEERQSRAAALDGPL
jgi:hypothetical protein